ncbi:MAG: hypothetical protein E7628_02575 [Ruminococcaceae bacterium]|nr:hypothetical protein [Oscillospiraceae bacterium]
MFISEKREDVTGLFRLTCRDAISSDSSGIIDPYDAESIVKIYTECIDGDCSPCVELAVFCSEYAKIYSYSPLDLIDKSEYEASQQQIAQIAYLRNAFADKAYRKAAALFDKVSAVYLPGFREVCEEVYYGRSTYALLPIFSSNDGQLSSFRQLISKYDLNIIFAVDVKLSDEGFMRYALLRKGLRDANCCGKINYLDISVVAENDFRLGEFLSSCEYLGASVTSVNAYPREYSENSSLVYITFDISQAEFGALCLFLEVSHIRYTPIGAYNIK